MDIACSIFVDISTTGSESGWACETTRGCEGRPVARGYAELLRWLGEGGGGCRHLGGMSSAYSLRYHAVIRCYVVMLSCYAKLLRYLVALPCCIPC